MIINKIFDSNHLYHLQIILFTCSVFFILFLQINISIANAQEQNIQSQNNNFHDKMAQSQKDAISKYESQFCGINTQTYSTMYVKELKTSMKCEMPLAITVDVDGVWYMSTKHGFLINYDPNSRDFIDYPLPLWKSRNLPTDSSQVWTLKTDPSGKNLWFTDEKQNSIWKFNKVSKSFEMFPVPSNSSTFGTSYPVSIDFDSTGNIYFVGIRTPSLYIGNISQMKNGTSSGISVIDLPTDEFKGIEPELVSVGSIVVDKKNSFVWISMLAFGQKGTILKYDILNNSFKAFKLPSDLQSPVGLLLGSNNGLWATDHGTNIFFKLDTVVGNITKYTTSIASPKLFGGVSLTGAYTLPYWLKQGFNNTIIFNEHTGNKIARFDPIKEILVEYWIPSQNKFFGPCDPNVTNMINCGIGNVLQFSDEKDGKIWFTEWSENKIGFIKNISLPFSVSSSYDTIVIKRGQTKEIPITIHANENTNLKLLSSSTFTSTGELNPSVGYYNENALSLEKGNQRQVSFILNISPDQVDGNYVLMLGAEDDNVSVLKAIHVLIL